MAQLIDQKENFNCKFGICLRGSAIFYIPPKPIHSKIILSNYWKYKNQIDNLFILANWRDMSGKLLNREEISFERANVRTLEYYSDDNFQGSCEIEVFSTSDIRIPYSAIMAVYECSNSISMVHNYSRAYSNLELEDGLYISEGYEGCWLLRGNPNIETFAVIHNGFETKESQDAKLLLTNDLLETKEINFKIKSMKPYESIRISLLEIFPSLHDFLKGKEGSCSLQFKLSRSFPRMLIAWSLKDNSEFQVTHSDFDYSMHKTDLLKGENQNGYVVIPKVKNAHSSLIIYNDRVKGNYSIETENKKNYNLPEKISIITNPGKQVTLRRKDGKMPSRIHTAIEMSINKNAISAICNLGMYHHEKDKKRFHWGVWSQKYKSQLMISTLNHIYGKAKGSSLCIRIYSEKHLRIDEKILTWDHISHDGLTANISLSEIFDSNQIDRDNFMFVSVFSDYLGFVVFTTLQKGNSFSLEHSF